MNGISRNLEFCYNNGSLSSNELAKQVFHVITILYIVRVDIYIIVSDAGGSNHGLIAALREKKSLRINSWLNTTDVNLYILVPITLYSHPFAVHIHLKT